MAGASLVLPFVEARAYFRRPDGVGSCAWCELVWVCVLDPTATVARDGFAGVEVWFCDDGDAQGVAAGTPVWRGLFVAQDPENIFHP